VCLTEADGKESLTNLEDLIKDVIGIEPSKKAIVLDLMAGWGRFKDMYYKYWPDGKYEFVDFAERYHELGQEELEKDGLAY
jgi:hypothetical protein